MDAAGNISWAITATALVLLMTPGVAFFYGGLVKAKSVISMMMMSFGAIGLIAVLWVLYGFSMSAVSDPMQFAGNPFADFGLVDTAAGDGANVALLSVAYGATFAIITVALISGAIADRARFGPWLIFVGVFGTLGYFPIAAWVWGGGWIMNLGTALFGEESGIAVIDYAGGTAVHINAGAAALALALVLGKRIGFAKGIQRPHNVPLTLLGAALLWFGWFGFNAGAEWLADDMGKVGLIGINTLGAAAAGILGWILIERIKDGKPTSVGAVSGLVAGLVAITPACANLTPGWALLLGALAGVACALAVDLKYRWGFDDSLDVVGLHLVGGLLGTVYLGFFATDQGLFTGGDWRLLAVQVIAAGGVLVYSFVVAFVIGLAIEKTIGFRVTSEDEVAGVDQVVHGEAGYALVE
ncbi:ammonium transporter [Microbacterium esteraromaticum]|uniref:Ammonium transporter n=1 Tax=Microbacterium esteraromaticum TaxID=57043 RepID=A0A939IVK9_9MICO|nr:ammonium transporter [Microbacterium esteraromaticum]MBN8206199.1 ammonium transporter [Microbacterium esteraromaticum]MBN8416354.1 ammonium transporter [Microbacterium esteraromaticum]